MLILSSTEKYGGHAIFINAKKFVPYLSQDKYPVQILAAEFIFVVAFAL